MTFSDSKEPFSAEESELRDKAAQLVRDGKFDLATRWTILSDWPNDFDESAVAAAWDMEAKPDTVREDLDELLKRGLIQVDQATARYRLSEVLKRVAEGLFGN